MVKFHFVNKIFDYKRILDNCLQITPFSELFGILGGGWRSARLPLNTSLKLYFSKFQGGYLDALSEFSMIKMKTQGSKYPCVER